MSRTVRTPGQEPREGTTPTSSGTGTTPTSSGTGTATPMSRRRTYTPMSRRRTYTPMSRAGMSHTDEQSRDVSHR